MAAAVRDFRVWGYERTPTVATVKFNGVEVFNGSIEIDNPPPETSPPTTVPMIVGQYNGDDHEDQMLAVEITVISGSAGFGPMEVNESPKPPVGWYNLVDLPNSNRENILINGAPPVWPSDGGPTLPGGTPENPEWRGWAFLLNSGDVLTFNYKAISPIWPVPKTP